MLSAVTTLQLVERDLTSATARIAKMPEVKRETDYYLAHIENLKTSKDFINNYRVFSYAMKAYGLSDMIYAKGFMQKVLDGGVSNPKSFANQLTDPRFAAFAKAFNFVDYGSAATVFDSATTVTQSKYVRQSLEDKIGQQNLGAQLALYFQRQAPNVKTGLNILSDKALLQFAQTVYNIPSSSATTINQDIKVIESKVNLADLQEPNRVQRLVARFAAIWDLKNSTSESSLVSAASGFNSDLMMSIQNKYFQF
jgi:hypothetical protein